MSFDPQAFINGNSNSGLPSPGAAPAAGTGQSPTEDPAPAPQAPKGFDPQRFINGGHATDLMSGEKIPLNFSGNTPETAKNTFPGTMADRMNLSFGNQAGNTAYLAKRFEAVKPIMDENGKATKDLAVLDKGSWYRVDPKTGKGADPWEIAKEYAKDSIQLAPAALGIGVAGAVDAATGGMALPATAAIAGATTSAVRTSLGRILGTYDASPSEQAWDVGFESLLNAAGAKVLTGVKPTAKWVANKLDPIAEAFKDVVESSVPQFAKDAGEALAGTPKAIFKKVFASYSVGENNMDTMIENTDRVKGVMTNLSDKAGSDTQAYHDEAIRTQVGHIADIAGQARDVLTGVYGSMRNKLLANVPKDFSVNLEDPVYTAYSNAIEKGIGALQVGGKELTGKDAADYLAKNGMKNAGFRMFDQAEMAKAIQQGAPLDRGLGYLSADKDAHGILKDFYSSLDQFVGGANRSGPEGARALLDFKKVATDLSYKAVNSEQAQGIAEIRHIISDAKSSVDNSVFQKLKEIGQGDNFTQLNATYDKLSTGFAPLLSAQKRAIATGDTKAYENLLSSFLARPRPNASARFAVDDAIQAADANGLSKLAADIRDSKLGIQVTEAAKAFNPLKSGALKADGLGAGMGALTAYAALAHNPAALAAVVGMQSLRSPTVAGGALATVQGLMKGQQMLSNMSKTQVNQFLSNPQAIQAFTTGVLQAPVVRAKANQQMQQVLQQATQRPQQ